MVSWFLLSTPQKAISWVEENVNQTRENVWQTLTHNIGISEIQREFWFEIKYLDWDTLWSSYTVDTYTKSEIDGVVAKFYRDILSKYPKDFIKKAYLREVYLFKDMKDINGNSVGWFETRGKIYLNTSGQNIYKFHHELFHRFDNKDGDEDNANWQQIFWKMLKPKSKDFSSGMDAQVSWYVNAYGMTQWVDEDQATIVEYLLTPSKKKTFFQRLTVDETLRIKAMILTGNYFDTSLWKFTRLLSFKEYHQISWFTQYEYYQKWGWEMLNHVFWNKE